MKKINRNLKSVTWKTTLSHCVWKALGKYCFISHSAWENCTLFITHLPKERSFHFSLALTLLSLQKLSQCCLRNMRIWRVFFSPGFKQHRMDPSKKQSLAFLAREMTSATYFSSLKMGNTALHSPEEKRPALPASSFLLLDTAHSLICTPAAQLPL